jgi:hypothetical protein
MLTIIAPAGAALAAPGGPLEINSIVSSLAQTEVSVQPKVPVPGAFPSPPD